MSDHDAVHGAAELALGLLSGPERAEALAHLEGCGPCRIAVEELADVADRLLLLAPEAEPPAGFETGVLARAGAPTAARRPRRVWLAAAAVVVVLAAVGGAFAVRRDRPGTRLDREYVAALEQLHGKALAATALQDATGQQAGQLFLYEGDTSWLFATVDDPGATGELAVELRFDDGRVVVVPGLHLAGGRGSLGATVDLRLRDLRSVRVVDDAGRVRYTVRRP
jgi:hypothetical protein